MTAEESNKKFLTGLLVGCLSALVIAAILFGTQIITTNEHGATLQKPQAPAKRNDGSNPSAQK